MITAKVQGLSSLHLKLALMMAHTDTMLEKAIVKMPEPMRDHAQEICPRSEGPGGHLADGIKIGALKHVGPGHVQVRLGVKASLWYGVFPEYGTSRMAAQPFMRPAYDLKRDECIDIFADEIGRHLPGRGSLL